MTIHVARMENVGKILHNLEIIIINSEYILSINKICEEYQKTDFCATVRTNKINKDELCTVVVKNPAQRPKRPKCLYKFTDLLRGPRLKVLSTIVIVHSKGRRNIAINNEFYQLRQYKVNTNIDKLLPHNFKVVVRYYYHPHLMGFVWLNMNFCEFIYI